jgi:hypothetical protein
MIRRSDPAQRNLEEVEVSWLVPHRIEESAFKRLPEGWVFTAPNPYLFGPRQSYLLSETQKNQIAAVLRPIWPRIAYLFAFVVMTGLIYLTLSFFNRLIAIMFIPVAALLGLGLWTLCYYLAIRSVLAGARRTNERVHFADVIETQASVWRISWLVTLELASITLFTWHGYVILTTSNWSMSFRPGGGLNSLFGMAVFGWMAVHYFIMLRVKLRPNRPDT